MSTINAETNGALGTPDELDSAADLLATMRPYAVEVRLRGTSALLFHRWQNEAVAAKSRAAKGSAAKKSDDVESYVYRDDDGLICLPGEYLRAAIAGPAGGAKYRQDPRSPRKSALDLFRASVIPLTELAVITTVTEDRARTWDYLDSRRVTVQRSGITRVRPAFLAGWSADVVLQVLQPQYIPPALLLDVLVDTGRLVGISNFRPTFGRFAIERFTVLED